MQYEVFWNSLRMAEPTLWSYLVLVVKEMIAHDCYDDLEHLTKILKELSSKYPGAVPRLCKIIIEMSDQPLEKAEGLALEKLGTDQVKLLTNGGLYKRYILERTLRQVNKVREDKTANEAERRKTVDMLLKSTVLSDRELAELKVVSTLLSSDIDAGDKLQYLVEDSSRGRHGTFLLWFSHEHPLYFSTYFVHGEGL